VDHATPEKIHDPVIGRLVDLITVDQHPAPYPDRFPHRHGATVTITLKDGRQFSSHVDMPRGSNVGGVDWNDVDAKYSSLVPLCGMSDDRIQDSLAVIHNFESVRSLAELTSLLKRPS